MRILLDTNAYTRYIQGDELIRQLIVQADEIVLSPIMLAELFQGFELGSQTKRNYKLLEKFETISKVHKLQIDEQTAKFYTTIVLQLRRSGKPIPVHDIWIAAQAMHNRAELVTFDKHFLNIEGLKVSKGLER